VTITAARIKALERAVSQRCPVCADRNEAVLRIRTKVVKQGDQLTPWSPVSSECPRCKRKIRITRVVFERADKGPP
jgi:hypothetical protein